jgi:hypothetical protein
MCVNTWGAGLRLNKATRSFSEMSVALIGFNKVAKRRYVNPAQGTLAHGTTSAGFKNMTKMLWHFLNCVRELWYILSPDERWRIASHQMIGGEVSCRG